ncbi:hypothetical protein BGW36DRAFT_384678 [Talaromyces proteolyticus]|uniref:Zn(2)-C6 fungal-type domain-containing protein n=1 Tax=Talaromyces proteolyticus TaxID=1131652 RepID=A0AAD4KKC7_9EURO|nr:uncharacterized protein BGW36DRAFT_384678 [Talaromyces proteolyticus]KAH8694290.1 hypothetical protein BGW36DRAFT_384678 [Talaromyces proteolyticus]
MNQMEMPNSKAELPAILFCSICDKPFSKEAQWKRHIAYCRKATGRTRPRSCRACNQSKIKCDFQPRCNQCKRKGIQCIYDQNSTKKAQQKCKKGVNDEANLDHVRSPDPGRAPLELAFSDLEPFSSHSNSGILPVETTSEVLRGGFHGDILHKKRPTNLFTFDKFARRAGNDVLGETDWLVSDEVYPEISQHEFFSNQQRNMEALYLGNTASVFNELSPFLASTEIVGRNFTKNRFSSTSQLYANMIIDMIRTYPQMMIRRETFPPFVHPHLENDAHGEGLPFPLENCMGISHLFALRDTESQSFPWSIVLTEMNSFINKFAVLSKNEALAALEASLMYLIMRATSRGSAAQDSMEDTEMILIHQTICKRAIELSDGFNTTEMAMANRKWKEWIFRESCRRVVCVWFAISLVFCVQAGIPCHMTSAFREMALPSTKTEWEASNETQWQAEYKSAEARRSQLSRFADLLSAYEIGDIAKLNSWNAGIDNLGILLNLALHVVAQR